MSVSYTYVKCPKRKNLQNQNLCRAHFLSHCCKSGKLQQKQTNKQTTSHTRGIESTKYSRMLCSGPDPKRICMLHPQWLVLCCDLEVLNRQIPFKVTIQPNQTSHDEGLLWFKGTIKIIFDYTINPLYMGLTYKWTSQSLDFCTCGVSSHAIKIPNENFFHWIFYFSTFSALSSLGPFLDYLFLLWDFAMAKAVLHW